MKRLLTRLLLFSAIWAAFALWNFGQAEAAPSGRAGDAAKAVPVIRVLSFTRRHPAAVTIFPLGPSSQNSQPRRVSLFSSDALSVDGAPLVPGKKFLLPSGRWRLSLSRSADSEEPPEVFEVEAALEIAPHQNGEELAVTLSVALEDYTARTLASETEAGTPGAALEAQAVVARTYALASSLSHAHRHGDAGDVCDLAHCQVLSWRVDESHLAECRKAAAATAGLVLSLGENAASGESTPAKSSHNSEDFTLALPTFHASCGGATSNASDVFDGRDLTGASAVRDPKCGADAWTATLPASAVRRALAEGLGLGGGMPPSGTPENSNSPPLRRDDPASQNLLSGVQWIRDAGGRVIQIRAKGRTLSGEAFARRLGALVGYGRFPSAHFTVSQMGGGEIVFQGRGKGHGVGLCQRGASELAREGADFRAILRHYFPKAGVISVYSMYDCLTGDNKCNKKK